MIELDRRKDGKHRGHGEHFDAMSRAGAGRTRRGKLFDSAQVQLLLLSLIGENERHGYELMREIETRTQGTYVPSPGVVYPTLTMLVEMDLIAETGVPGARKSFAITQSGRDHLAKRRDDADAILVRLEAIGEAGARSDSAPVRRAMGNLRTVLMERMSRSGTTDQHALEAARIIDLAAGEIERLP